MNRLITAAVLSSATLLLVISSRQQAGAAGRAEARQPRVGHETAADRQAELARIRAILDQRIADPILRRRVADKLATLAARQVRLIASLSERLAVDGDGPAAGVALLLITALLIVS